MTTLTTTLTTTSVDYAFPSGERRKVALPRDRMVVAIAPYLNLTHPCATHSISGCQGEPPYRSLSNGCIELWLPRDGEFEITISGMEMMATGTVTTFENSPTCRTEFRLL